MKSLRSGGRLKSIGLPAPGFGAVPYLDVVATLDAEKKTASVFVLNRDLEKAQDLEINWRDLTPSKVTGFETITGSDLKAGNTFADPKIGGAADAGESEGRLDDDVEVAGAILLGVIARALIDVLRRKSWESPALAAMAITAESKQKS